MLKKILLWSCAFSMFALCGFVGSDSDRKAKAARCYGRIKIVTLTESADFKVRIVETWADLHVQIVSSYPHSPGLWQMETATPDYRVRFVQSGEDFSVKFVDSFPGVQ